VRSRSARRLDVGVTRPQAVAFQYARKRAKELNPNASRAKFKAANFLRESETRRSDEDGERK